MEEFVGEWKLSRDSAVFKLIILTGIVLSYHILYISMRTNVMLQYSEKCYAYRKHQKKTLFVHLKFVSPLLFNHTNEYEGSNSGFVYLVFHWI